MDARELVGKCRDWLTLATYAGDVAYAIRTDCDALLRELEREIQGAEQFRRSMLVYVHACATALQDDHKARALIKHLRHPRSVSGRARDALIALMCAADPARVLAIISAHERAEDWPTAISACHVELARRAIERVLEQVEP